jgi:superfamily II DNA or RNA helicase
MGSLDSLIRNFDEAENVRGRQFELLCKWFLENDPEYKCLLKQVWLWRDWPRRWSIEKGVDLVAETYDGEFWAIQAKAYAPGKSVTKRDVDSFLSDSSRKMISYRLLLTTAGRIGRNAEELINAQGVRAQNSPIGYLCVGDLSKRDLAWPESLESLGVRPQEKKELRQDQRRAVDEALVGLKDSSRGQIIRACGTGKTLIGLRLFEQLKAQTAVVFAPTLSLVSQLIRDWTRNAHTPLRFRPICSDDTVGANTDSFVDHVSRLGYPATTSPHEVRSFLNRDGKKVLFCTYRSADVVVEALKGLPKNALDLAIFDEAHHCAGADGKSYSQLLSQDALPVAKRIFMTATPRIASDFAKALANSKGWQLASMDDASLFGPVLHSFSFSQAIREGLLADYVVEVVGVDDPVYRSYAENGEFVSVDGKKHTDASTLASHIALIKAIKKHDLRRVLTFHSRVNRAEQFAEELPNVLQWLPEQDRPEGEVWTKAVYGRMPADQRDATLDRLRELNHRERGIVTNSKCLSEGVDVQELDGVAFVDPRYSYVDIIQAVGRAIRTSARKEGGKKVGVIVIPVYLASDEDPDKALASSRFKHVWRILRALRSHDDVLAAELDAARAQRMGAVGASTTFSDKIRFTIPTPISVAFAEAFYLKTVNVASQPPPYDVPTILKWADSHHQRTGGWPRSNSGTIPEAPDETWNNVNSALVTGFRGLPGGSSLPKILSEHRRIRNIGDLPPLTLNKILSSARDFHARYGKWPNIQSGYSNDEDGDTWAAIDSALRLGGRGLPGGSSLAQLLHERLGVRNFHALRNLAIEQILKWADAHHAKHGKWPNKKSGEIAGSHGETWEGVRAAFKEGLRGLPKGTSVARLLQEHRKARNPANLPDINEEQILQWADFFHTNKGRWPSSDSGKVADSPDETWRGINNALKNCRRGLSAKCSLADFLARHRGKRNPGKAPQLSLPLILKWIDEHKKATGEYPDAHSGPVSQQPGETWATIAAAMARGSRGLPRAISLPAFLRENNRARARKRKEPSVHKPFTQRSALSVQQVLEWADEHHRSTGRWPTSTSGQVAGKDGEDWNNINASLRVGLRGLPGGSSLAKLLEEFRDVRNRGQLPPLTEEKILEWADHHYEVNGKWPRTTDKAIQGARGEKWSNVNACLGQGLRGLPGGSSLAKLLSSKRGSRNKAALPRLSKEIIETWAKRYRDRQGRWPRSNSGNIQESPLDTWQAIDQALLAGLRGMPSGSSLHKFCKSLETSQ